MKYLHIKFNNFFDYQTILEILSSSHVFLTPKLSNPEELKLSFTYYYSDSGIIEFINTLCASLNITFTTESEECSDE